MSRTDELVAGTTWEMDVEIVDATGTPVDLTGATVVVQLRRPSYALVAEADVTVTDAAAGKLRWEVPVGDTAVDEGPVDCGVLVTLADETVHLALQRRLTIRRNPVEITEQVGG